MRAPRDGEFSSAQPDPNPGRKAHNPKEIKVHRRYILVKRLGEPEDIAYAALFLASDEDSLILTANLPISVSIQVGL